MHDPLGFVLACSVLAIGVACVFFTPHMQAAYRHLGYDAWDLPFRLKLAGSGAIVIGAVGLCFYFIGVQ